MITENAMQLKAKLNNKSKELNIAPQVMLQNYIMECFLERLSKSEYAIVVAYDTSKYKSFASTNNIVLNEKYKGFV